MENIGRDEDSGYVRNAGDVGAEAAVDDASDEKWGEFMDVGREAAEETADSAEAVDTVLEPAEYLVTRLWD